MKRRTASILVGSFVIGGLVIAALFVVFLAQSDFWVKRTTFVLNFENSVSGLSEGAPVQFQGVRVGRVMDIRVVTDPKKMTVYMPVFIQIDPRRINWKGKKIQVEELFDELINRGLRARIRVMSYITGQRMIELDFMPDTPPELARRDLDHPEIPTVPSTMQEISDTVDELPLEKLLIKLTSAVEGIEETVNSPRISESLRAMNRTMQSARKLVSGLEEDVPGLAEQMNATLGEARGMMQRNDKRLKELLRELEQASLAAEKAFHQMEGTLSLEQGASKELASNLNEALEAARSTLQQAEASLAVVEDVAGDPELRGEVETTLKDLSSAARSIRSLARYLERNPDAVWRGKSGR
ncbi:MAG: MlaD family protein [Desulfohalobiaceae bacterium]